MTIAKDDRRYLTRSEVEKLIDATKGTRNEARDKCLLLLMFRHGLRVSEALSLKLNAAGRPSFFHSQRSVGAGIEPLTVVAMRGVPVKLTGVSAIVRSNPVPDSTLAIPVAVASRAQAGLSQGDIPSRTPLAARP